MVGAQVTAAASVVDVGVIGLGVRATIWVETLGAVNWGDGGEPFPQAASMLKSKSIVKSGASDFIKALLVKKWWTLNTLHLCRSDRHVSGWA